MGAHDDERDDREYKPFTVDTLIKALAILFVLGIYVVIFLKILVLP